MSGQSRDRRKRTLKNNTRHQVERLEGRALLASIAEFGLTTGSAPTSITNGPNGNLWFTESGPGKIGEITPSGTVTEFSLPNNSNPQGITTGPNGNLWFTEYGTNKIGEISTGGTITEYSLTTGSNPQQITTGSNGNLWFTEQGTGKIGEIVPSGSSAGTITEFALASGSQPFGITSGPNGNLWFTESGTNKVGQIVPSGSFAGTINTYSLSTGAGPLGITTGSDGNLWFAENGGGNIGQVTPGGSVTEYAIPSGNGNPKNIVSGPLGDLYFTEGTGNVIIQMTTQGQFTDFTVPSLNAGPFGITQGPDNHIWFTEYGANQIGRLNLNPTAVNDTYTAAQNTSANPATLSVNAANGVLANDTDPEIDPLTVLSSYIGGHTTAHGFVNMNADGSFTYTPTLGYVGTDTFTYQATDGSDSSNTATVTFHVDGPPVAVNDTYTTPVSTTLTVSNLPYGVLANDTDPNTGHTLTSTVVANPSHGTVTLNSNGSFTYIPTAGYHGSDSFTYHATDSDGVSVSNTATVNLTVDSPAVATNDSYTTDAGTLLTVSSPANGVLANDTAYNGDTLTVASANTGTHATAHGSITMNANGTFTYTPTGSYTGSDTYSYNAYDGYQNSTTPATITFTVNALPTGLTHIYEIQESDVLNVNAPGVLAGDSGTGSLTAVLVSGPGHAASGGFTLQANGSFTYTPTSGYSGTDSFTYEVYDGIADGNPETVTLLVDAPPTTISHTYLVPEGSPDSVNVGNGVVTGNTSTFSSPLSAYIGTNPSHGSLTWGPNDGSFIYTPANGFHGVDSFTYYTYDGFAYSTGDGTVTLNVDNPPVVVNKSFDDVQNTSLNLLAGQGLLVGTTDADSDPLTAVDLTQPSHGTVTVNANGSFSYIPTAGYYGNDSFTYTANDGYTNGNTGTVSIYVDQPPAGVADFYNVVENTSLNKNAASGVLANDTDTDSQPLSAGLVTTTTHGTLNLFQDGSFTYTPATGYYGSDTFTYQANDGITDSPITTVTIHVDAPPVGVNDSYNATENQTFNQNAAGGVLANDTQAQSEALTASLISNPSHGALTFYNDGSFQYIPTAGYYGTDSFTYKPYDGIANGNLTTVSIFVDSPPVAVNDSYTSALENTPLVVNAAAGVLANDTQAQGESLTAVNVTQPTHGTVTLNADGSFTYTPTNGYYGTDSFTYEAYDGHTDSLTPATVTIRVDAPPVAVADNYEVVEGGTLNPGSGSGVLANDTQAQGDALTAQVVSDPSHSGTFTLNADGSFTYIPTAGFYGTDSFTYKDSDGYQTGNTVTVTILVDQPPVAVADSYSTIENTTLTVNAAGGVLANDTDAQNNPITASFLTLPSHGSIQTYPDGAFTYVPTAGYYGTDSFTYQDSDGFTTGNTVTVSIDVDAPPVAVNDSYSAQEGLPLTENAVSGVLANDTQAQGNPLTAVDVTQPTHGTLTLNADGSFTYTPNPQFFGTDSFTYNVNDGYTNSLTPATVTLNVAEDFAPTANNVGQLVSEGGITVNAPGILTGDTDSNGQPLTAVLVTEPSHGTLTFNANGSYVYTPNSSFGSAGTDSFTFRTFDNVLTSAIATVTLTFDGSYDAPTALPETFSTTEGATLTTSAPGLLVGATDYWNLPLTAVIATGPTHGTLTPDSNGDGGFIYTPAAGYYGTDSFTYEVNNGFTNSTAQTVTLNISQTFGAPVAANDSYSVTEATPLTIANPGVLANDTDPNGDPLTAILVTNPAHGSVALNADGSFTYTPAAGFYGTDSFTYKDNDGHANSNTATVSLTVTQVFYPPVAVNDSFSTPENTAFGPSGSDVLTNDTDPQGLTLTVADPGNITTPHGLVALASDGTFTYTPNAGYFGTDSFTYTAYDGHNDSNTATVTIAVAQVIQPPVAVNDSYTTSEATPLTKTSVTGVLANDTDPQSLPLTAILVTNPAHGSVAFNANGSFTYVPAAGFYGTDSFTYKDNDGSLSGNTATVSLTVTQVFYAPVTVSDSFTIANGETLTISTPGVLANDTDPNGLTLNSQLFGNPTHDSSFTFNSDGSFTYIPTPGFVGTDSFTYKAADGQAISSLTTVTITVTNPLTVTGTTASATAGTSFTGNVGSFTDANPTAPIENFTAIIHWGDSSTTVGTITQPGGVGTPFEVSGTHDYSSPGSLTASVVITDDNENSASASTAITVSSASSQPPVAVNDSFTTSEATPLTQTAVTGVLANDTDPQSLPLTAILVTNPAHGTLALNADGSFTYVPAAGFYGTDSFTYKDNDGSLSGNTATVSLTVTQVFYPPVAVNDSFSTPENTAFGPSGSDVLTNDTDPQDLTLTVANPGSFTTAHGTLNLASDGTFTYTPNAGFYGTDSFTYMANDGHNNSNLATVTIHVTQVIQPPVAVNDSYTLNENASLTQTSVTGVLANDTDPQSLPLTAILVTNPAHGSVAFNADGSFTYIPAPYYYGADSFTYKDNDGSLSGNTATVTLTVAQVQYAPVAVADSYTVAENGTLNVTAGTSPLVNDSQPQGDPFYFYPINIHTSQGGLITQDTPGTGAFTYVPAAGFSGTDTFQYQDIDSSNDLSGNIVTVTITVTPPPPQPPVAANDTQTVAEGGFTATNSEGGGDVLANDTDNSLNPLTALLVSSPTHGSLTFNANGTYVYTPNSSFGTAGTDSFSYRAFDGSLLSNVATVTLTFDGNYIQPLAQSASDSVAENGSLTTAAPGLLAGASDYWNLPLTAIVTNQPTHGTLVANADGSFAYTPNAGYFGTDSFTFEANNGHTSSPAQTVTITVNHVNHPPVAVNDSFSTTAGQPPLTVGAGSGVLANDTDADGDPLTAILVSGPAHGTLSLNASGSFVYTAAAGYSGTDSFTYEAFDGQALSNVATATLTVNPKPLPPVAVPGDYDGDGKADIAVYIPSLGAYDIKYSDGEPEQIIKFGTPGVGNSIPAPGDYDHSGKTELAVYIPASGEFIYRPADGGPDVIVPFGTPGFGKSIPAPGDYFGTGQTDIAVYLPSMGVFAVRNPISGVDSYIAFGTPGAGQSIPTPGDYDGSGKTEISVYLPAQGAFAYRPVNGGADQIIPFGIPGAGQSIPMPGDYDGSGKTEVAVYMPSQGRFAFRPANGGPDVNIPFGTAGAGQTLPSPGDYTGVGHDELAVYIPASGTFIIRTSGTSPDMDTTIGIPGLGETFPVTVVDEALAQMPTISGLSIAIPDLGDFSTNNKKKNNGGH